MLFSVPVTVVAIVITMTIVFWSTRRQLRSASPYLTDTSSVSDTAGRHLLVSLGSGGHTTEMFYILDPMDLSRFTKRTYYITSGDSLSREKAIAFEKRKGYRGQYGVKSLARARRVKQSWSTTPITAFISFLDSLRHVRIDSPDLLICNGPGTCVMLVLACLMIRYLGLKRNRIIFIESFARVESLSLSGKILIHLVDRFLVMWPELAEKYEKAEYAGMLI